MLRYPAPAKLNLFLHVIGRRDDGYHLLQTAFRFIDFADELAFGVRSDGHIGHIRPVAGIDAESDLCVRAARSLQRACGCRLGADIMLQKRLPIGGGLGGGSSDAATTLMALNRLWNLNLPRARLAELGLTLGADVPVFLFGRSAFAEGIGERLQPLPLEAAWYLVLVPQVTVSTAEMFAARELTRNTKAITIAAFLAGEGHNDLEPVICRRYPEVARHLAWLRQYGKAAMTGSGGCVFCAFETESDSRAVLARLPGDMHGFVARGLDRHPLYAEDA